MHTKKLPRINYEIKPVTRQLFSEKELRFQETVRNLRLMDEEDFDQVMEIAGRMTHAMQRT
jgi:hypothetical protein